MDAGTSHPQSRSVRGTELRRAGKLMRQLMQSARTRMDEALRPYGATSAQVRMLYEVKLCPGASGAQLARACAVTPQTAQAMLASAVDRAWLLRGKDEENRRLVTFTLTERGSEMLNQADLAARGLESEMWRGVETDDVRALASLVEEALANLNLSPAHAKPDARPEMATPREGRRSGGRSSAGLPRRGFTLDR